MGGEEKSKKRGGRAPQKKRKKGGQFPRAFFSPRERIFQREKRSRENLRIVCGKEEKLHAKRETKSCARVKLLLHGTTVTTLLNRSLRSF